MSGGSQGGSQGQKVSNIAHPTQPTPVLICLSLQQRSGNQSLRPVTIKQFNAAAQAHPDAEFTVDDVDVSSVRRRHELWRWLSN